jgi:hypothetical protein
VFGHSPGQQARCRPRRWRRQEGAAVLSQTILLPAHGNLLGEFRWCAPRFHISFARIGTDSPTGGHHFRAWKQNGTLANSGAWFIGYVLRFRWDARDLKLARHSASKEEPTAKKHMIVPDGYNIGRDWFVEKATAGSHWKGMWWKADVEWRQGLLEPGKHGKCAPQQPLFQMILHSRSPSPGVNHGIEQDGIVAILTIHRL